MSASLPADRRTMSLSWLLGLLRALMRSSPSSAPAELGAYGALAGQESRRP
jgi:hypothetical protein